VGIDDPGAHGLFYIGVGIVAIVYSNQVQAKLMAGDVEGARVASNNAKMWGIIGCVVGGLLVLAGSWCWRPL